MPSISIVGIGRLGGALAIALSRAGLQVESLIYRSSAAAELVGMHLPASVRRVNWASLPQELKSDIVLIATADPDITTVANELSNCFERGAVVLHTSGSLSSTILSNLSAQGYFIGSMHPLVSVSDPVSGADNFQNAFFCIEGDEQAVAAANMIVTSLGGRPFSIDSDYKALYHAAAVTACGHLVALLDIAIEMLTKCGIDAETSKDILLPLVDSTIRNLETQTPAQALTGSFARVDAEAFDRHMAAIEKAVPDAIRDIYIRLGERSLDLAAANGADPFELQNMRELISIAKRKTEC